jgi:nucleoside-diphosphate-sugar epimerase
LNKQITIIGCGWLGFPLAKELIKKGSKVKGTTTSKDKLTLLTNEQIEAFYLNITSEGITGNSQEILSESDVLVLNIPPGLRKYPEQNYVALIQNLIPHIEASPIKKVLFISSTSVYADEEYFPEITEVSKPNPNTESGKQLLKVETLLQNNTHFKTTVVRFAGLFGNDRHPANQLSGKTNLKNPEAPVNLIQLTDSVNILLKIIEHDVIGETFNASTTPHPTKQSYYTSVCKSMNLPVPNYDSSQKSKGKIILSNKLEHVLNYQFQIKL